MKRIVLWTLAMLLVAGGGWSAYASRAAWLPKAKEWLASKSRTTKAGGHGAAHGAAGQEDPHAGHDHAGHAHGAATDQITLTEQAAKNLGLKTGEIEPTDYWKHISVPATVVEQPGRSERRLTAVMNGVVLRVHAMPGQSIRPADPVVDVQLAGEGIVTAQSNLLRTIQDLELVDAELARLLPLVKSGGVAEKVKIEKQYERRRLESARQVQVQKLLIRGLTQAQIGGIVESKEMLRELTIRVPTKLQAQPKDVTIKPVVQARATESAKSDPESATDKVSEQELFIVERIGVFPGRFLQPGDEICDLAAHAALNIEGTAFENEAAAINRAIERQWAVTATFEAEENAAIVRDKLRILYMDNSINPTTRTLHFFVPLPNEVVRDNPGPDGKIYRTWRFKPGQKLRLAVPVEQWTERIVVPAEGVVREGPDAYVFRVNGKQMERVAVHVEHQDSKNVVLANDGSLFPGDVVALNSAYQLNLALKRASGSGVDPHAGHNH